jgi:manganese/iron transport system substrate-binding protein
MGLGGPDPRRRGLGAWGAAAVAAVLAGGCSVASDASPPTLPTADAPLMVVATISILADMVEAVGGDRVTAASIVPVGGDPHVHEPLPSDARLLASADLVVRNGLGLEPWLDVLLAPLGGAVDVVTVADGLAAVTQDEGGFAGDPDPHLWMDPTLAAGYVEAMGGALAALDPAGAEAYAANAATYLSELDELDRWIEAQVAAIPPRRRKLVTTHDAFRYFGRRYGIAVVGTIWSISTEREPSAEEIRRLVDAIRDQGVPLVFVETTINPRLMERVADDAGVEVGEPLYGDSVGEPGSGADTYLGMMRANTRAIVSGLAGGSE